MVSTVKQSSQTFVRNINIYGAVGRETLSRKKKRDRVHDRATIQLGSHEKNQASPHPFPIYPHLVHTTQEVGKRSAGGHFLASTAAKHTYVAFPPEKAKKKKTDW